MKKFVLLLMLILLPMTMVMAGPLDVPVNTDPVFYRSAAVEAAGGAQTATASGFDSLFSNPAGLSRKGGELLFGSVNVYSDFMLDEDDLAFLEEFANSDDPESFLNDSANADTAVAIGNKIGLEEGVNTNLNMGFGLAAFGLGLGFMTDIDLGLQSVGLQENAGDITSLAIYATPKITSSLVAGLSHGFDLGAAKLHVGADAKAIVRTQLVDSGGVDMVAVLQELYDPMGDPVMLSAGYGFDAGAILELPAGFSVGVAANDIGGTEMMKITKTLGALEATEDPEALMQEVLDSEESDTIPMTLIAGIGFDKPGRGLFDLKVSADYIVELDELAEEPELIDQIRAGAEISVLGIAKVRGGINRGILTAGVGVDLLLVEANATYYGPRYDTEEEITPERLVVGVKVKL
ncbi:MAG: hypothetical protein K9M84_12955 [Spirochaetia bacterium]|nr:hypothetical protein [Spirochaetia bacterium]